MNKSEIMRLALEAYLRYHGLHDPELKYLTSDVVKEKAAEYRDEFMRPFVEAMEERAPLFADLAARDYPISLA